MSLDRGNQRAVIEAEAYARLLRRSGYPSAQVAPQYCIDENDGTFYTFTICVDLGPYQPKKIKPIYQRAMEATKARLGL